MTKQVKVELGPDGLGTVTIDGTEIPCTEIQVIARPNKVTEVYLKAWGSIEAETTGDRSWVAVIDPITGDVLREGWVDDWSGEWQQDDLRQPNGMGKVMRAAERAWPDAPKVTDETSETRQCNGGHCGATPTRRVEDSRLWLCEVCVERLGYSEPVEEE